MKSILSDKTISILGSTGSVGTQALDVARQNDIKIFALTANSSVGIAERQIREFAPEFFVLKDEKAAAELRTSVADTDCKVLSGEESILEVCSDKRNDTVVNSITGIAGLMPSLAVIESGTDLALANKETIVTAGKLVMSKAKSSGSKILPVDSEHSAIFQCIGSNYHSDIKRILLTASGGPFFGYKKEELKSITPELALAHPTWKMGPKITIDSASLMNKGFEVIEAVHLFDVNASNIQVVVHKESIIHSMVEFKDKATMALMSFPDMRLCVQYALSYPNHIDLNIPDMDLFKIGTLNFKEPDMETFKLLKVAYKVANIKDTTLGATLNGANEVAVSLFLNKKISFLDIFDLVESAVKNAKQYELSIENIKKADIEAREYVNKTAGI